MSVLIKVYRVNSIESWHKKHRFLGQSMFLRPVWHVSDSCWTCLGLLSNTSLKHIENDSETCQTSLTTHIHSQSWIWFFLVHILTCHTLIEIQYVFSTSQSSWDRSNFFFLRLDRLSLVSINLIFFASTMAIWIAGDIYAVFWPVDSDFGFKNREIWRDRSAHWPRTSILVIFG